MENEFENLDSTNEELENADSANGETEEVDVEAIKQENAKLKKTNQELYERERKAKGFVRGFDGKWIKPEPKEIKEEKTETKSEPLSLKDIRALQDVHDDDVDEVVEFAKFKGISITEAKKLPAVQALLSTKKEERTTAEATNTGKSGKSSSKNTYEAILERAESGQLPEDDEGIKALSEARLQSRLDKIKS